MNKVALKKLSEISNIVMGQSPSSNYVFDGLDHGMPFLQGCAEFGKRNPIPLKSCSSGPKKAIKGSTLISVRAPVGDTNIADRDFIIGRGLASINANGVDADYLSFAIDYSKDNLQRVSQGSTFAAVGSKEIHDLQLPVFELTQQKKIAQILTSIDEQIELSEKLIEKKILQRDGLIYDLMSGGKNWVDSKLNSLAEVVSGGTPSRVVSEYWGDEYPWVTPTDITSMPGNYLYKTKEMISEAGLQNSSTQLLPAGTVLMTSRATLGESKITLFPVCTNQGFKSLIPKNGVDSAFLMYQMRRMRDLYSNLGTGTTFLEVNKRDTENFSIPIPTSELEQKRISSIFLLMDDEIESENKNLHKLKAKKQGLMQDLFTGQVRVN